MSKRTLVTSALPYANGPLHLGHLAGAYLTADFFVRFKRLSGENIIFICGSDEHGVPITIAAEKEGKTPQDVVDFFHEMNEKSFEKIGISFDYFGRTSSPVHRSTSQEFFLKLYKKNLFIQKEEAQLYDAKANMFLPDRYVKGTCPSCGYEEAYGDQCERCGTSLSANELLNPKSAITGETPELKKTTHWYLPLGKLQPALQQWLEAKSDWKPNVIGQCNSWLNEGLADRAVTRDLAWGVPVPLPEADGKVLYVWFDAPIGYISATKEWAEKQGNPDLWKAYWKDPETDLIHFIGKDNIVFHCLMFPAMLMEHGEYVLPKNVPANEFLNLEGKKLSTSRGWAVWLKDYLEYFEPDLLRYALGSIVPETKDSDFSWKDFQSRVNNELADVLGNFVFRTLSFTVNHADAHVPELKNPNEADTLALSKIEIQKNKITAAYEQFRFKEALSETMELARIGNRYFTESEPWKTRKSDPQACHNALHVSLQISAALSVLLEPVLPFTMPKLRENLGYTSTPRWQDVSGEMLPAGQKIQQGEILFQKIEDDRIQQQIGLLESRTKPEIQSMYPALKDSITYDDFVKLDIRSGVIVAAEVVPKSNKLLKLLVDIGIEQRTVVSGIAKYFTAEEAVGKKISLLANLKPRAIMGIESNGMILMAENEDGTLFFVHSDAEAGACIS